MQRAPGTQKRPLLSHVVTTAEASGRSRILTEKQRLTRNFLGDLMGGSKRMFLGDEIAFPVSAVLSENMVTSVGMRGKGGLGWDGTVRRHPNVRPVRH